MEPLETTGDRVLHSLASGVAGAAALTAVHETARRTIPRAPRMDVIGRRGIAKSMVAMGVEPPKGQALQTTALVGDLVSNSLFYSLVGLGSGRAGPTWRRGLLLGVTAGIGAAVLPPFIGLGRQPGRRGPLTHLMTVLWYAVGGVVAAATLRGLSPDDDRSGYGGLRRYFDR
jgi:hypothetical protein